MQVSLFEARGTLHRCTVARKDWPLGLVINRKVFFST